MVVAYYVLPLGDGRIRINTSSGFRSIAGSKAPKKHTGNFPGTDITARTLDFNVLGDAEEINMDWIFTCRCTPKSFGADELSVKDDRN